MGGAHNVALANIRKGLEPKPKSDNTLKPASQKTMGGARNVALSMID